MNFLKLILQARRGLLHLKTIFKPISTIPTLLDLDQPPTLNLIYFHIPPRLHLPDTRFHPTILTQHSHRLLLPRHHHSRRNVLLPPLTLHLVKDRQLHPLVADLRQQDMPACQDDETSHIPRPVQRQQTVGEKIDDLGRKRLLESELRRSDVEVGRPDRTEKLPPFLSATFDHIHQHESGFFLHLDQNQRKSTLMDYNKLSDIFHLVYRIFKILFLFLLPNLFYNFLGATGDAPAALVLFTLVHKIVQELVHQILPPLVIIAVDKYFLVLAIGEMNEIEILFLAVDVIDNATALVQLGPELHSQHRMLALPPGNYLGQLVLDVVRTELVGGGEVYLTL